MKPRRHRSSPAFWRCYSKLPPDSRQLADRAFHLLRHDPRHPSLHFKLVGRLWSARVGRNYRALGVEGREEIVWYWIGPHDEYERIIGRK
jgi:hypothetical protein